MKVLIIEEDPVANTFLEAALAEYGHQTMTTSDGERALKMIKTIPIQLIITEWRLSGMDGLDLCQRIRSISLLRYPYIIVYTSKAEGRNLPRILNSGADDYMAKPVDLDEFKARLQTAERVIALNESLLEKSIQMDLQNKQLKKTLKRLEATQAQMLQSEKMASIGQLAAGVAHEINNPTGFVSSNLKTLSDYHGDIARLLAGYHRLLKECGADDLVPRLPVPLQQDLQSLRALEKEIEIDYVLADIPELISDCREGMDRIQKIVMDLRGFAHPGDDQRQPVDLNAGLASVLNVINNEIKYKASVLKKFGDIPNISGFPQQLNQVFLNILVNAGQAIEKKGTIEIVTYRKDQHVIVKIGDDGCGIAKEHVNRIFDPFFTTKDVGQGTGLGMNIAYNIIEKHQGRIRVQSRIGEGTTFTIELPIDCNPSQNNL